MDFGSFEEQLTFVTRSSQFLIGCMFFFFFFFYSSASNTSPKDSRLLIDCQWFFETEGESDRQSELGIAAIRIVFLSMVRDKVVLKKAALDFWKVSRSK